MTASEIDIKKLFQQSIKNRQEFLEEKVNEWLNCMDESKKAKIIIKLIQLEPSHLAEPWVLDQVIKWLRDYEKNKDYLQETFIAKGIRNTLTQKQRDNLAKNTFTYFKVKNLEKKKGSQAKAIRDFVLNSDDDNLPEDAELAIKQRLKRYRKKIDEKILPWPYYGRDIIIIDEGTDQERLEFYLFNKPVTTGDVTLIGNTKITFPRKKHAKTL